MPERALDCFDGHAVTVEGVEVPDEVIRLGHEHGCMLDYVAAKVETDYILTLDSDCLPVHDGWIEELVNIMDDDHALKGYRPGSRIATAGILHPWGPPPDMKKSKLEYRVRSQHCWETTHVACQLIRTEMVKSCALDGIGYTTGDDTGLGMVKHLKGLGMRCIGYKPTRCPKPEVEFDAEFNRYTCIVFGDAVVHIGGFSRTTAKGDEDVFKRAFGYAPMRIIEEGGAEFLLNEEDSYEFTLDREEEVAAEKMQRLFGLVAQRMT